MNNPVVQARLTKLSGTGSCPCPDCVSRREFLQNIQIPTVPNLYTKIKEAVGEDGAGLEMSAYDCGHGRCIAGWAVKFADVPELRRRFGYDALAKLIFLQAYPDRPIPNFLTGNVEGLRVINENAEWEAQQNANTTTTTPPSPAGA